MSIFAGAREAATGSTESKAGVGGLLDFLLYHTISPLALDIMYWSFGALAIVMLWLVPPRWPSAPWHPTRS